MKNLLALCMIGVCLLGSIEAEAQLNQKQIRKNNKRISNFKGKKTFFEKDKRYNYLALSLNAMNYFGDLSPLNKRVSTDISLTKPAIGVMFGHRFGPFYSFRASFTYGTLRGDDFESADLNDENAKFRYVRNLQFRNRIKELTLVGVFDLFRNESTYISRVDWTPYAFIGLTLFHHNPQAFVNENSTLPEAGTWVDLEPLGTEGQYADPADLAGTMNEGIEPYNQFQLAIPFGIGVRYRLNQVFDLSFEMSYRYLFTDYIDDVSKNYVDPGVLTSDLARELSDRSRELSAAESGSARDFEAMNAFVNDKDSDGYFDGFGTEGQWNLRGNRDDNDMYFVTTIKVAYIIGATFRRAKFR